MEGTSRDSIDIDSVESWIEQRNEQRDKWNESFKKNFESVADIIAESLTKIILSQASEAFNNAYCPEYNESHPLTMSFLLAFSPPSSLKEWSQNTELTPFHEWFEEFEKLGREQETEKSQPESPRRKINILSSSVKKKHVGEIDTPYFQEKIKQLAKKIVTYIADRILVFSTAPGNKSLHSKFQWLAPNLVVDIWPNKSNQLTKIKERRNKNTSIQDQDTLTNFEHKKDSNCFLM
jgi:hypothetical protein